MLKNGQEKNESIVGPNEIMRIIIRKTDLQDDPYELIASFDGDGEIIREGLKRVMLQQFDMICIPKPPENARGIVISMDMTMSPEEES